MLMFWHSKALLSFTWRSYLPWAYISAGLVSQGRAFGDAMCVPWLVKWPRFIIVIYVAVAAAGFSVGGVAMASRKANSAWHTGICQRAGMAGQSVPELYLHWNWVAA